jgi:PAP2 superfamily
VKAVSRPDPLYYLGVALTAVLLGLLLAVTPPRMWMAFCFAGAPVLLAVRWPLRRVWLANAVLGGGITLYYRVMHGNAVPWVPSLLFGAGSASILIALAGAAASGGSERYARLRTAAVVALFPAKLYLGVKVLAWTAALAPLTCDLILTVVDRSLGGDASFAIGRLVSSNLPLRLVSRWAYDALPLAVMIAAALRWRRYGEADPASIPLGAGVAAALGILAYLVVPAAGPVYAWGARFPFQPPSAENLTLALNAVDPRIFRNAMPSLHFTAALMVAWGTWPLGRAARFFGISFLGLTALATLGSGEHYAIDLVVAVPFAVAIEMAVRQPPAWWRTTATGAGVTAAWLVMLRWAPQLFTVPGLSWVLVALTLAVMPAVLWWRVEQPVRIMLRKPNAASPTATARRTV